MYLVASSAFLDESALAEPDELPAAAVPEPEPAAVLPLPEALEPEPVPVLVPELEPVLTSDMPLLESTVPVVTVVSVLP